jgi:anaerobic selenocysteine-containing dehydrogenase
MGDVQIKKTVCLFCPPGCGIDVHIKDNVPVKVESNLDSVVGPICIKGEVIPEWYQTEARNRLLRPLLKVNGRWKQISWDEALDTIAKKFTEIKEKYGSQAVGQYLGQVADLHDLSYIVRRFNMGFGTPSLYSVHQTCWWGKGTAHAMTYGMYSSPTLITSKCTIIWAAHPIGSVPFAADYMTVAKTQGTKWITVDPRRTFFAKASDIHLQLRPGTDGALALGMLNVIIKEKLYDEKFVEKWVLGFDKLAERCEQYTPEKVEEITWVPADKIRAAARLYATTKPASIFQGNCLDNVENGFYASRGIQALVAVTGNADARGGATLMPIFAFSKIADRLVPKEAVLKPKDDPFPLLMELSGIPAGAAMNEIILTDKPYPIKSLVIQRGNPVLSWADTNKTKKALDKLDFVVVMDFFMTETAELADLVLPAATFLEQQILYNYVGRPMVVLLKPVLEPPGECWPDWKLWFELGKRLKCNQYMPWETVEDVQAEIVSQPPVNASIEDLKAHPEGYFYAKRSWKRWETDPNWRFPTPSGKVELYSERLEKLGFDPLPAHVELSESPVKNPELTKKYPLILITGLRSLYYLHAMHRSTPSLRARDQEPMVEINTETARNLNIESGDFVIVETPKGRIQMKAAVNSDIHPKVVCVPHCWAGMANQNLLTNDDVHDPVWGGQAMRGLACRVRKAFASQASPFTVVGQEG